MARTTQICFGTFGRMLTTPVHSEGWWFAVVANVLFDGGAIASQTLAEHVRESNPRGLMPLLRDGHDACWVRARVPVALGYDFPASHAVEALIHLGLLAIKFESNGAEVTFPFLCRDQEGRATLWFSRLGPDESARMAIGEAFWRRLLDGPDYFTAFDAIVVAPDTARETHYSCRGDELSYRVVHR